MQDLTGKVAVVTGAGSGIGRALALELARHGVSVAVADLNGAAAKESAELLAGVGPRGSAHEIDVSVRSDMDQLAETVLAEYGVVDIVVNNAGIVHAPTRLVDIPTDLFERVMQVNFWGTVHGSLAFVPHLRVRPSANLVNIVSYAGLVALPQFGAYASSKFAARAFTEALGMELNGTPVCVTMVCPGATRTSIMANSPVIDETTRQTIQTRLDKFPTLKPETVARRIVGAIQRDRARCVVGPDSKFLDILVRSLPGGYRALLGRPIGRYLETLLSNPN